jgi:hypothetical protein
MSVLFLRKVAGHPQAQNAYRVVQKSDEGEIEIGSIGIQFKAGPDPVWRWGIDTVVPMREIESEGEGKDRKDCEKQFKAAWEKFCSDPARVAEFMEMKRKRRG